MDLICPFSNYVNNYKNRVYRWSDSNNICISVTISLTSTAIELRSLFENLWCKATAISLFRVSENPWLSGFPLQFVTWNFSGNTPNGILTFRNSCTVINTAARQRDCIGRSSHTVELKRRDCRYDRLWANPDEEKGYRIGFFIDYPSIEINISSSLNGLSFLTRETMKMLQVKNFKAQRRFHLLLTKCSLIFLIIKLRSNPIITISFFISEPFPGQLQLVKFFKF